jgi:tetratricopeptide (TPR) repeat protein
MITSTGSTDQGRTEARRLAELARAAGFGDAPDEALEWSRDAETLLGNEVPSPLLADVLRWRATVLRDRGRTSEAEPLYRRSLEIATKLDYDAGRAHATNDLASLALRRGDVDNATRLMTDALVLAERAGETRLIGMLQQNLGIAADIRGKPAEARTHYNLSLQASEASHDTQLMAWVLNNLGLLDAREGRHADASRHYLRALGLARARGDLFAEGIVEENRAELALTIGAVEDAYPSLSRAQAIAEMRGDNLRLAAALRLRGAYERMCGRPADATDTLRHALTLSAVAEDALLGAETLYQFALALREFGDNRGAATAMQSALDAFERIGARDWVARVRSQLSHATFGRYF